MENYKDKRVKIEVNSSKRLFYEGEILSFDEYSVTFRDKYDKIYTFNKKSIIEISEVQ